MVVGNIVVVGSAFQALAPQKEVPAGHVRGFDVRSGTRIWIFHTIPRAGEFGNDTWQNESWSYTGQAGGWGPMARGQEFGDRDLPIERPTKDLYGGPRPRDGRFRGGLGGAFAPKRQRERRFQGIHHC